jgi:rubrerythrin
MTMTFENARKGLEEIHGSDWSHKIVDLLEAHGEGEGALLTKYEELAAESSAPAIRYLSHLILDDERRHHRLLVEMANAVAWGWSELSPEPAVPEPPVTPTHDQELATATRALLEAERADHTELKRLRKELRAVADTTLWGLLIDLMLLDTDKHIRVLRFLTEHVVR